MVIIDTEIFKNYFLFSALDTETGKIKHCELYDGHDLDTRTMTAIMNRYTTLGFNSNNFDIPIIVAALRGWDNQKIKALSDNIILNRLPLWRVAKDYGIEKPQNWNHIDIIEVAIGKASLKIYGARLHEKKIQDLPIEPDAVLTRKQMIEIRDYCENDLHTTAALYEKLKPQIKLRESMSEQYGIDLRSKSDAQIAEAVIVSELRKLTGAEYKRPQIKDGETYRYQDPRIISFQSKELNDLFERILQTEFEVGASGSIVLPEWMKDYDLRINGTQYTFGIGGLHSCEKSQYLVADDNELLFEADVRGYYPSIILQQRIFPKTLGDNFLKVYQSIVERRNDAKSKMQKLGEKIYALEQKLK